MRLFKQKKIVDREAHTQTPVNSDLNPMPIIVGSPRSGTTLLRLMLDSHSELAIPPETAFLTVADKLTGEGNNLRKSFFHAIVNYAEPLPSWQDFEISTESFWTALSEIKPFNLSEGFRCFYRLYAAHYGKSRWGDKTPIYCHYLDPIRRVLPEARFVHIIRDGRDAALSLRQMWFSPGWDMKIQASYWRDCVLAARRAGLQRDDYVEIRYEDLILKTQKTLETICNHVNLHFEAGMLTYYERSPERLKQHKARVFSDGKIFLSPEQRFKQQQRTTKPPDPSCVFSWKQIMDGQDRRRFESVAGGLLKELGYDVDY